MANKHSVARGSYNHAQHGDPKVRHADGCPGTIPDAQHVAHGFEEGIGVLLTPRNVLQEPEGKRKGRRDREVWGELLPSKTRKKGSAADKNGTTDFPLMDH